MIASESNWTLVIGVVLHSLDIKFIDIQLDNKHQTRVKINADNLFQCVRRCRENMLATEQVRTLQYRLLEGKKQSDAPVRPNVRHSLQSSLMNGENSTYLMYSTGSITFIRKSTYIPLIFALRFDSKTLK